LPFLSNSNHFRGRLPCFLYPFAGIFLFFNAKIAFFMRQKPPDAFPLRPAPTARKKHPQKKILQKGLTFL
jgi:hypothetical protein